MLAALLAGGTAGGQDAAPPWCAAVRQAIGPVEAARTVTLDGGIPWVEAVVDAEGRGPVLLRVAPAAALEDAGFTLEPGQLVRVRYLVGDDPPVVERIGDVRTGRTLRLRYLHGEPTWDVRGHWGRGAQRGRGAGRRGGSI